MSETLTLKQQGKTPEPRTEQSPPARARETLRQVKPHVLPTSSLMPSGYGRTEFMTVDVPPGWSFGELLKPVAWANVVRSVAADAAKTQIDRIGSLIYVNTADNSFAAWLRIDEIIRDDLNNPCGIKVSCMGPSFDVKSERPCPLNLKTGKPWRDPASSEDQKAA